MLHDLVPEAQSQTTNVFVCFENSGSKFMLPILEVIEICEKPIIRSYPEDVPGHLGVANIRGNIVPIISMSSLIKSSDPLSKQNSEQRLIVISFNGVERFGVLGDSICKVTHLEQASGFGTSILTDAGLVLPIQAGDILRSWGIG